MKILGVGDSHGKPVAPLIRNVIDDYEYVICIGDYVDAFDETTKQIIANFQDLLMLKKDYPEKVVLLLGNHDIQYYFFSYKEMLRMLKCSGYRASYAWRLNQLFWRNQELFQVAFQEGDFLFTHAGISNAHYAQTLSKLIEAAPEIPNIITLADKLNLLFKMFNRNLGIFDIGPVRGQERDIPGGMFWADYSETYNDPLIGYHQIVGHTRRDEIEVVPSHSYCTSIAYIDCIGVREWDKVTTEHFFPIDTETYTEDHNLELE